MPEGIVATVDDGFATLDFVDPSLRGPALASLLEIGGPATIETITRQGPRRQYRVPEGNAREAGLLDGDSHVRGLNADGTPDDGQGTGGTGTTTGSILRTDTGAAAALVAADPNVNAGPDAADWHTPTAEYTSENKYVGTTTAAAERAMAPSPFTGTGTSAGGTNAGDTPTHREVIDNVKAYEIANPKGTPRGGPAPHGAEEIGNVPHSVQALNLGLADQEAARGDDPGSRPDAGGQSSSTSFSSVQSTRGKSEAGVPEVEALPGGVTAPDTEDVVEYPEGEPHKKWRRDELDAYALKVKGLDTSSLDSKDDVLAAINSGK
jgi:hypothetical protein